MSTEKHTPGPWETNFETESQITVCQKHGPRNIVLFRWPNTPLSEEDRANARLIAAAPDLLEALEAADRALSLSVDDCGEATCPSIECQATRLVKAAIDLAKGEPSTSTKEITHGH